MWTETNSLEDFVFVFISEFKKTQSWFSKDSEKLLPNIVSTKRVETEVVGVNFVTYWPWLMLLY